MPDPKVCEWIGVREALSRFVVPTEKHQSSRHIKPLHYYVACRLVLEGGFHPDSITPRPPFIVKGKNKLHYDAKAARGGERTVLGGLKTKDIDVVVALDGVGPVMAVSMKGTLNAYRNLTNRMEEAVGDCTNLHIAYPALVYSFLHVVRGNREGLLPSNGAHFMKPDGDGNVLAADIAIRADGNVSDSIIWYHEALSRLSGRRGIRNDFSKYEAIGLVLVDPGEDALGEIVTVFPEAESPLNFSSFFGTLYREYDTRFVYSAPALAFRTRRHFWDKESPAIADARCGEFVARIGVEVDEPEEPPDSAAT